MNVLGYDEIVDIFRDHHTKLNYFGAAIYIHFRAFFLSSRCRIGILF